MVKCKRKHLNFAAPAYEEGKDTHLDWWMCDNCDLVWNERNTGPHWRPRLCPERKEHNGDMTMQAVREKKNHDGDNNAS
jgi:hypothetical protein